jgi:Flp pilus assembly pilin Flp
MQKNMSGAISALAFWRHYKTDENGATAVEFGLIGVPFLILLIGLLEMCIMFAVGASLHGGTAVSGRLIRTGQIQAAADPQIAFEEALCEHVNILMPCGELTYEVINIGDEGFRGASVLEPDIDDDGEMNPRGFDPGKQNEVILIRAAYRYPIKTPMFAPLLSDSAGNTKLFMSTVVLQNEPYAFDTEG